MDKIFMQNIVKIVVGALGLLILAGASSIMLRDTYPKSAVDAKDAAVKAEVLNELQHSKELQSLENAHIRTQLGLIRDDQLEIKEMIKENGND